MQKQNDLIKIITSRLFIVKDFSLNILASLIVTAVAQIIVYPWLAKEYSPAIYGMILTMMGVGNTIVNSIGNSINNSRLLMEGEYNKKEVKGDFLPVLYILSLISAAAFCVYILLTSKNWSVMTVILLVIYIILGNARCYGVVAYRLDLNFVKNLYCSLAIAAGNIVGVILIVTKHYNALWPLIFVIGELFGILVLCLNSDIFREPLRFTSLLPVTLGKIEILIVTTLIANILIYLDRLLLLPILGGEAVASYTTASFFGKCLGMLLTPMAGVLLGYYAQKNYKMTKKKYRFINLAVMLSAAAFFAFSLLVSKWVTGLLYPTLITDAAPYLVIANLTAIIAAAGNMTQPAILKYAPTHFQIVIQIVYCIIYLFGGYFGAAHNGLWGFSVAALMASVIRLLLLTAIGEKYING